MKKYSVITFMFNDYDILRDPLVVDENFDYYCLTDDKKLSSNVWKCIYIEKLDDVNLTGVQKTYIAKYSFYEYLPKQYEYWINIDASILITCELFSLIKHFEEYDIGLSIHPSSMKYVDEYYVWEKTRGLSCDYSFKFIDFANKNKINLNTDSGLIECTVKIYKNNKCVIDFISDVYNVLKAYNNFEDANDQCYFTVIYGKHEHKLKTLFFYRQLYSNSKYFNSFFHKTWNRWINGFTKETNNNFLLNNIRYLNDF